jgi:hypothetical protein
MSDKEVTLKGHSVATPDRRMVNVSGELSDGDVEGVAGGGFDTPLSVQQITLVVQGLTSLHKAAWAV